MNAVLLDIEGTTTPITFVTETLFPYSRERIGGFVERHFGELETEIIQLVNEHGHDGSYTVPLDPTEPGSVSVYLEHLIDADRKSTPLKSIQGRIWEHGYETGELHSAVFDDVPAAFDKWRREGKVIAIYSSGSVLAQQLLFRHTQFGDLTPFIAGFFDTTTGPKREGSSYLRIASELSMPPSRVAFYSDIVEELDAAWTAGMKGVLVRRPGNKDVITSSFPSVERLDLDDPTEQ